MFSVREVFTEKTARDRQRKVGASNLCNPCTRCLAENLMGLDRQSEYIMGARIGTAIHDYIERFIKKNEPDYYPERRVILGEIPGYGKVSSTSDLYIPSERRICDWKTTDRQKIVPLARDLGNAMWLVENPQEAVEQGAGKALSYVVQTHLYARGMERTYNNKVDRITIGMIPRDAKKLDDIVERTFPYNPAVAEAWWDRGCAIWAWLEDGGDPDELESAPGCFVCEFVR